MTQSVEVYVDLQGEMVLVGLCRFVVKGSSQSSMFEYANSWLEHPAAFALDPANLPLQNTPIYLSSTKSALPGAIQEGAPDLTIKLVPGVNASSTLLSQIRETLEDLNLIYVIDLSIYSEIKNADLIDHIDRFGVRL